MKNKLNILAIFAILILCNCKKNQEQQLTNETGENLTPEVNVPIESLSSSSSISVTNSLVTFVDKKTYADFTDRYLYNPDSVIGAITSLSEYSSTRSTKPAENNPGSEEYLDLILNGNNEVRIGNEIVQLNFIDSLTLVKTLSNSTITSNHFNSEFSYVDFNSEGAALRPSFICGESGVGSAAQTRIITTNVSAWLSGCQYGGSNYAYSLEYNKFGIYFTIVYKQGIVGSLPFNPQCNNTILRPYAISGGPNARVFQIGSIKPRCQSWQYKGPGQGWQNGQDANWSKDRIYSSSRALHKFDVRTFSDHPSINTSAMNTSNFQTFSNSVNLRIRKNM